MENLMFFDTVPDTSFYLHLGYGLFFVVILIYVASLYIRNRNLKQDIETLESMQDEKPKSQK